MEEQERLERELRELTDRWVHYKEEEAARMNEAMSFYEDIMKQVRPVVPNPCQKPQPAGPPPAKPGIQLTPETMSGENHKSDFVIPKGIPVADLEL